MPGSSVWRYRIVPAWCPHLLFVQLFTGIYGVGVATADKWYKRGLRTIGDVRECEDLKLSETQQLG